MTHQVLWLQAQAADGDKRDQDTQGFGNFMTTFGAVPARGCLSPVFLRTACTD